MTNVLRCRSEDVNWGGDGDATMEEMAPEVSAVEIASAMETLTLLCPDDLCCFVLSD